MDPNEDEERAGGNTPPSSTPPAKTPLPPESPYPSSLKGRRSEKRRQIGFALPNLHIPPSNAQFTPETSVPYSANVNSATSSMPSEAHYVPHRKASEYMYQQLHGGLNHTVGFGAKAAYWIYNKFSSLSKQWFTHIFLSIVIILYTVGGAAMFVAIEGKQGGEKLEMMRYLILIDNDKISQKCHYF